MKNTTGKLIIVLALFLMVLTAACEKKDGSNSENGSSIALVTPTAKGTSETAKSTVAPIAKKEIPIYTMDETTQEVEAVTAAVSEDTEITPELIVDLVAASLAERLIDVDIDSVTKEQDTVIVSFIADAPPVINVDLSVETTILDAIAQSLVDNLLDYQKVIFRVEGKGYQSANLSFGLNDIYLDGNKSK